MINEEHCGWHDPKPNWDLVTPGIPDDAFVRGKVPMTRQEVRWLALCKARLGAHHVVYDIGAGTGSLAIEAARLVRAGSVYAVERDPEAISVIRQNVALFGLSNVYLVEGEAPEAMWNLPAADRVLVGGSGGRLREILHACWERMPSGSRVVVTAVALETFQAAVAELASERWQGLEICCLNVARVEEVKGVRLWKGHNPVYLLAADC